MDARHTPCLDLELVCWGTRSLGYRQGDKLDRWRARWGPAARGGARPVSSMKTGTREELERGELDDDRDEGGAGSG
jgi:hypothetical protein